MPSPFESLSMVLLEAWNRALPALVNARCKVLRGQVVRADGGLYYRNAVEFAAALDFLIDRPTPRGSSAPGARLRRPRVPLADGDGEDRVGAAAVNTFAARGSSSCVFVVLRVFVVAAV